MAQLFPKSRETAGRSVSQGLMTEETPGEAELVWPGLDGQRLTKQLSGSGGDAGPSTEPLWKRNTDYLN